MNILEKIKYIVEGTGFDTNIENDTIENNNFRKVIFTAKNMQLVLMSVEDDIGVEVHKDTDQFFRIERGTGKAIIGNRTFSIKDGSSFIVPMGNKHNVVNTGDEPIKLYAIYSPPHHPDGKIDKTKPEGNKEAVKEDELNERMPDTPCPKCGGRQSHRPGCPRLQASNLGRK
jgi:mannose-6-phosphate isomerase-like protein (cupin superfamily)